MDRARFDEILSRYEDGLATPDELRELGEALKSNAEYRADLVARNRVEVALHEWTVAEAAAQRPSVRSIAVRQTKVRRRRTQDSGFRFMGIAASVLLAAGVVLWFAANTKKELPTLARVANAQDVRVTRAENTGASERLSKDDRLHAGDTVQSEASGRAELIFEDSTHIEIASGTTLILSEDSGAKIVKLNGGEVQASVAKQPPGKPMQFVTPYAQATVLGTKLKLALNGQSTRLEVTEGRVSFKKSDGVSAVEVGAGRFAVAEAGAELSVKPIQVMATAEPREKKPLLPALGVAVVNENFENGKLEGWDGGNLVSGGAGESLFSIQANSRSGDDGGTSVYFSAVKLPTARLPGGTRQNQYVFQYQPGLAIRFAYLLEGDAGSLRVQGFNNELDDNFGVTVEAPVRGAWTVVQLRLDDFEHNDPKRREEKLRPGSTFRSLNIFAGGRTSNVKVFRVDDLIIAPELPARPAGR